MSGHLQTADGAARPTRPVPAYLMFGALDPIQPWNGRPARGRLRPALLSAPATAQTFAQANRATRSTSAATDGRTAGVRTVRYSPRPDGAPVELIEVSGVGHVWPRRAFDATALVVRVASTSVRLPAAPPVLRARSTRSG
jgi:poly(3-hydroxybutyrate) depolymerase